MWVPFGYIVNLDLLHNLVGKRQKPIKLYGDYKVNHSFMERNKWKEQEKIAFFIPFFPRKLKVMFLLAQKKFNSCYIPSMVGHEKDFHLIFQSQKLNWFKMFPHLFFANSKNFLVHKVHNGPNDKGIHNDELRLH